MIHKRKHIQRHPPLVCFSVTVTKHQPNQLQEGRASEASDNHPTTKGSQGRWLNAGTCRKELKEEPWRSLLTALPPGYISDISYVAQAQLFRGGTTQGRWGSHHQLVIKTCPTDILIDQANGGNFSLQEIASWTASWHHNRIDDSLHLYQVPNGPGNKDYSKHW